MNSPTTPYRICSLYSGSKGNSVYFEYGGARILVDAGKNAKALCTALDGIGVDPDSLDAILVTHEHTDHTSALIVFCKKHAIPVHMLVKSAGRAFRGKDCEALCNCLVLYKKVDDFRVRVKDVTVTAFATSHDSESSVGFKFSAPDLPDVGIATDTGYVTSGMRNALSSCESVVIESNHDEEMLREGPYPPELKDRVLSRDGHLSNADCAEFVAELYRSGTKNFLLAHLSEINNLPEIALSETRAAIGNDDAVIKVASQYEPIWLTEKKEVALC